MNFSFVAFTLSNRCLTNLGFCVEFLSCFWHEELKFQRKKCQLNIAHILWLLITTNPQYGYSAMVVPPCKWDPRNQTQQSLHSLSKLSYLHYNFLHRISTWLYLIAIKFNKLLQCLWASKLLVVMKSAMTTCMSETNPSIAISTNQGGPNCHVPIPAVNQLSGPSSVSLWLCCMF
jgi:hypothetical protein